MSESVETHPAIRRFRVVDNCIQVGGVPVDRLADRVGQTPFYAYDREMMTGRVEELRRVLPQGMSLHFAVKANPMPAVVQHMASLVDGLDVASLGELRTALDTGMAAESISFAGPGKTDRELAAAIAAGVVVNMESEGEMDRIARLGESLGYRPRVALRVNPDFELKASGMKMAGGPRQFGVDSDQAPALLARIGQRGLEVLGFHIFSGSQNLRADSIVDAQNQTLDLVYRLAQHVDGPLRKVNIGGGFGIPYHPNDRPLDLAPIAENLASRMPDFQQRFPGASLIIELGRYLVGEAGLYVCRILDKKISRSHVFLIADGGLHHHLAASGNFGQVIRRNYPVALGNRMAGEPLEVASVVGPLCTPLDLLADKVELPSGEIGDLFVVFQSGAYGLTASPRDFLSHPHPVEVLV